MSDSIGGFVVEVLVATGDCVGTFVGRLLVGSIGGSVPGSVGGFVVEVLVAAAFANAVVFRTLSDE